MLGSLNEIMSATYFENNKSLFKLQSLFTRDPTTKAQMRQMPKTREEATFKVQRGSKSRRKDKEARVRQGSGLKPGREHLASQTSRTAKDLGIF